jgi:hypothetical protein
VTRTPTERDGRFWAGKTVRLHEEDVLVVENTPTQGRTGPDRGLLVVDDMLYGVDADGRWVELGDANSIDPDSGTTPAESSP